MEDPQAKGKEAVTYQYTFTFANGQTARVTVRLDSATLNLLHDPQPLPPWTALGYNQCPNCPLNEAQHPHCPAAVSLIDMVNLFSRSVSYETVDVCIESEARRYVKRTSLQGALSSLIGLCMVTSGCPVMGKLKPMVRHHLPFAKYEETLYRVLSMYLLAQYFLVRRGKEPDWTFKKLAQLYKDIDLVNTYFHKRFLEVTKGDASLNALTILHAFAETIAFSLDENLLDEVEQLFRPYLEE